MALASVVWISSGPASAHAQRPGSPAGSIEIVLDGSGSMRGRIGDVEKMDAARDFLNRLRAGLGDGAGPPLGLRVFGAGSHRLRRDCRDTRLLLGPSSLPEAWDEALRGVEPLGVSPLAHALTRAATDTATTYVLVTDGSDNCGEDACARWREIVGGGGNRRSRLHVVALDPDPDDVEALRCLSRAGSGTFLRVTGPSEIGPAALRLARILRNVGLLDVRLSSGDESFAVPVRVLRPLDDEVVAAFGAREPREVPAGIYTVALGTTPPVTVERVMILPGETVTVERDDFGRLLVSLLDDANEPLSAPVSIRASSGGLELRYSTTGEPVILREGTYDVAVDRGDSVLARRRVPVAAGETARVSFGGAGTVRVVTPGFEDPPPTRALLIRGGEIDTLSVGVGDTVPVGRYRLVVHTVPIYVSDAVVVEAGRETAVELPSTGVLEVELLGPDGSVSGQRVDVREPLTGEVYGTLTSGERRLVMPGTYSLEMRTIPPRVEEGVVVEPGRTRRVVRRGMGRLTVRAPADTTTPAMRMEVLAEDGVRRLGEAVGSPPALALWPGTYLARVWKGRRLTWEGRVSVASGETARIDLIDSRTIPTRVGPAGEGRRP